MDLCTQRALKAARAARRRETLDTTPMKKATKRWATLQPAKTPGLNLSGRTIMPPLLSWSSLLKWKMRKCRGVPSITPPLMLPGAAASRRALFLPCTHPKQPAPDITWPRSISSSRSKATSTSFASWVEPFSYFLRHMGSGSQLLRWRKCAFALDLPQDFVWMCVITFYFHFFYFLPVCLCLALSVLNQSSPMMNVKKNVRNVLWYIFIIFNYCPLEPRAKWSPVDLLSTSVFCYCTYMTTSFSPHIVQYYLRLRGQGENISLPSCYFCPGIVMKRSSFFFNSLNSLLFSRLKELLFHIVWMMYVVEITSALDIVKLFELYHKNTVWHF